MRRIRFFGVVTIFTAVSLVQIGCDKKKDTDRSVSRMERPDENEEPGVFDTIQEKQYSEIGKTDQTPMGYLAIVVRSRDRGKMSKSLMNLRSIGQAVEMYRSAEENYPPSFEALTKAGYISSQAGRSAGNRKHKIIYLPPKSNKPASTGILAFDPVCYPPENYAVLLIDGTASTMTLEDLKYQLEQQGIK